jgi:dihydrolipoamide dehydrogenase
MAYDVVFLGGGPAGYEGAIAACKNGLKAAVVEMDKPGGTCLHWGCIPTKTLLHSVKILKQMKNYTRLGVKIEDYKIDTGEMVKNKNRVVSKLTKAVEQLFLNHQIELIKSRGKIKSPGRIILEGEPELETKYIVVATGSRAAELPVLKFNHPLIMSSSDALELADIPEKLLVVGAGAVGIEIGLIYSLLGSQVTIIEMLGHILPGLDTELTDLLQNELQRQRMTIHVSTALAEASIRDNAVMCTFKQGENLWEDRFSKVLVSVGRSPNSEDVAEDSLNLERDRKGFIKVNENLQTNLENVFACGDVVGSPLLAHKASHQAISIVDFIRNKKPMRQQAIPAAVFSITEISTVGLSEADARARGMAIKIGRFAYAAGSRSNAIDEKRGMVKIITDDQNMVVGGHIVGAEAGELMPVLTLAVNGGMNAEAFKDLIFVHPTLGENIWEAVGSVAGFSIHV